MRAVQITEFGGPEVLHVTDLPDPVPSDGLQLVEVTSAGINYADTHRKAGIRLLLGHDGRRSGGTDNPNALQGADDDTEAALLFAAIADDEQMLLEYSEDRTAATRPGAQPDVSRRAVTSLSWVRLFWSDAASRRLACDSIV